MKSTFLILALYVSTYAQQTSGPVVNTATVSIEADSDSSNDGKVSIKTRQIERVTVANDGNVGIGISTPLALLHFGGDVNLGAVQTIRLGVNEIGTSDFGWTLAKYAGSNGETRQDNVFCWGYNVGPGGNKIVASEHLWGHCTESRYRKADGGLQLEHYELFLPGDECSGPQCVQQRNYSTGPTLTNGVNTTRFQSNSVNFGWIDNTNEWLKLETSATTGDFNLFGNSSINYSGTKPYLAYRYGLGMIGSSSATHWNLFSGGITGETVTFFANSSLSQPLTLKMGNTGAGFRIGANGPHWQVTSNGSTYFDILTAEDGDDAATPSTLVRRDANGGVDALNIKINHTTIVNQQCGFIANSNLSAADTARALNQLLGCLRDKNALIAPDSGP